MAATKSTSTKSTTKVSPAKFAGTKAPTIKVVSPKPAVSTPAITMGSGPVSLMRNQVGKPGAGQNAGLSKVVKERIALAAANKEKKDHENRVNQAAAAKLSSPFTRLKAGTPAFIVAESIIDLFPTVEPVMGPDGKQIMSRTQVAVKAAQDKFTLEYTAAHAGALSFGERKALEALQIGFRASKSVA